MCKQKFLLVVVFMSSLTSLNANPVKREKIENVVENFSYYMSAEAKTVKHIYNESDYFPDVREFTTALINHDKEINASVHAIGIPEFVADLTNNKGSDNKKTPDTLINVVMLEPSGWIMVANDDLSRPILAYSLDGNFSTDHLPIQAKELIAFYRMDIKAAKYKKKDKASPWIEDQWKQFGQNPFEYREQNTPLMDTAFYRYPQTYNDHSPIKDHLLKTAWDQRTFYNDHIPVICWEGEQSYTGCVATAAAQIMRYYKWPVHGTGTTNYSYLKSIHNYQWIFADHSSAFFDWDAMPEGEVLYPNDEVAELMFQIGAASYMQYRCDASSTYTGLAAEALRDHFYYKYGGEKRRSNYSSSAWNEMLRDERDHYRPVLYRGCGDACHAFVIDGYGSDDSFAVNFGWSGWSDGYYILDSPADNFEFRSEQRAYTGIEPNY